MEAKTYTVPEARVALSKVIDALGANMAELSALAASAVSTEAEEKAQEMMPRISEILNGFFVEEGFMPGPFGLMQGFAALQGAVAAEKEANGGESALQEACDLLQGAMMGTPPTEDAVKAMSVRLKA